MDISKIDPTNTFITADWHLGEDRFQIMQRPFKTTEEMSKALVEKHNSLVKPDDILIFVGDAVYDPSFASDIAKFNGRKIIVKGNHDVKLSDEELSEYFELVIPEGDGIELKVGGVACFITHYPTRGRKDRFNLVGHIHSAWKYQLNSMNIGVDTNHFYPYKLDTVPFHHTAISTFYDDDVWAAYHEVNQSYQGKRGQSGSYFDKK